MKHRVGWMAAFVATLATLSGLTSAEAAKLHAETLIAWQLYVEQTEARIASELEPGYGPLSSNEYGLSKRARIRTAPCPRARVAR